ncbi:MAG: hypothetical protein ACTIOA_06680 [Brachybacterium tyrofermentans]
MKHHKSVRLMWDYMFVLEWGEDVADSQPLDVTDELPKELVERAVMWGERMDHVYAFFHLEDAPPVSRADERSLEFEYLELRRQIEELGYTLVPETSRWPFPWR